MAKPKLSKQQLRQVERLQNQRAEEDEEALVVSHQGWHIRVEDADGEIHDCDYRKNLGEIVAGDRVTWSRGKEGKGVVTTVLPRHNLLSRLDAYNKQRSVAANIDQVAIVSAVVPAPNSYLINRYIAATLELDANPLILFNKADMLELPRDETIQQLFSLYQKLGFDCLWISVRTGLGMQALAEVLSARNTIFAGLSGVGKSSLIKALLPELDIRIGEISEQTSEGKHTTRASHVYHLPQGGNIIDSPGVRDFTPALLSPAAIYQAFPEIADAAEHCRFSNCQHKAEPDCGVKRAAEEGQINQERLEQFFRMMEERG